MRICRKINVFIISSVISYYLFCASILLGNNMLVSSAAILFSMPNYYNIVEGNKYIINKYFFVLIFLMLCGSLLNLLVTNNGVGGTLIIIGVLSISHFISTNIEKIHLHVKLSVILMLLYYYTRIVILKHDPNELYVGMSRNYVGLIIVLFNALYSFSTYILNKKPDLLISVLSLVLTVLLVGRSSIGCQLGIVLLNILWLFRGKKLQLLVMIAIGIGIGSYYFLDQIVLLYKSSSFAGHGLSSPRYKIWEDFFSHMDMFRFVLGIDTTELPLAKQYNGNLHNEYFNLIARTGIGALPVIALLIIAIFRYYSKKHIYLFVLLLIASIRIFFDTGVFINNLGITYYTLIIYPFLEVKFNKKHYDDTSINGNDE